jgi:hypothetical protein
MRALGIDGGKPLRHGFLLAALAVVALVFMELRCLGSVSWAATSVGTFLPPQYWAVNVPVGAGIVGPSFRDWSLAKVPSNLTHLSGAMLIVGSVSAFRFFSLRLPPRLWLLVHGVLCVR